MSFVRSEFYHVLRQFQPETYDLYVLGALEHDEGIEIYDHLRAHCSTCEQEIHNSRERATMFSCALPPVPLPRGLRERIVRSVEPAPKRFHAFVHSLAFTWAISAALVVLALVGWVSHFRRVPPSEPTVVSRMSPPPVPQIVVPSSVPNTAFRAEAPPRPSAKYLDVGLGELLRAREDASVLNGKVAQLNTQVAHLEAALQAKELQISSAKEEVKLLQARGASTTQDGKSQLEAVQLRLSSSQQHAEELARQVRFYQTAIQSQRAQLQQENVLISLLRSPTLRLLDLRATEQGGAASARAFLVGDSQVFFYAANLPVLPASRTYQLWLMRNRGPAIVSGGIFQPDTNKNATLSVPNALAVSDITALAVTEEPAGGRPLPTGHKILVGALRS